MKTIILFSALIFTASSLAAEDVLPATIDETFGFAMHRDVPYVQATLDQEAHPEQILDIYTVSYTHLTLPTILRV